MSVVARGNGDEADPTSLEGFESPQVTRHAQRLFVCRESLENLTGHQVEEAQPPPRRLAVEPLGQ